MGIFHQTEVLEDDCGVSFLNDTEREHIAKSLCQQVSSFNHLDENSLKKVINEWDAEELKDIVEHDLETKTVQVQTLAMCDLAEALNIEDVPVEAGDLVSPRYLSPRDLCLVNGIDKMAMKLPKMKIQSRFSIQLVSSVTMVKEGKVLLISRTCLKASVKIQV